MNDASEMLETAKQDRNATGEKINELPQIRAIVLAALSAFSASILFNWTSPAIPVLVSNEYPHIDLDDVSYLSVIPPVATVIISPTYPFLLDKFGRKKTLLSVAGFHFMSYILIAEAKSIWVFYLSRVLFGTADVFMFGSLPAYTAEVTTPKIRGRWGNVMMFFIFAGQFAVNGIGYYCSIRTTAYTFCTVPVVFFLAFVFMPESPYYLLMKSRRDDARESLRRLRGAKNVEEELEQIAADVRRQMDDSAAFKDLFAVSSNRKALRIALVTMAIQHFSGATAFAVYNQYIFSQAQQDINEGHSAMILSSMLAVGTIFGPVIMERAGRNKSMVVSCFCVACTLLAEAIYFYLQQEQKLDLSAASWFPIVGLVAYVITFSVGLGLVPGLLLGELFPPNMRGHVSCLMNVAFGIYLAVTTKLFHYLMTNFGLFVPFLFFSICCFAGTLISYYIIPETSGKTLQEIQQILKRK